MKNNIEFYQHYANADQHPKFKMLRVEYGWAGEGRFWALNNRIAQSEDCELDISKKYNRAAIASDLDMNMREFKDYIQYLIEECELVRESKEGIITTDIVQENFSQVTANREKARERKQRNLEKVYKSSGEPSKSSGEQNKKGKERKGKNNTYSRIVDYLNRKTNSNFKVETKKTQDLIKARLKEGFEPKDFKIVIDFKCDQWFTDDEMHEYLRPQTLFNNKFEGYLNAAKRQGGNNNQNPEEVLKKYGYYSETQS